MTKLDNSSTQCSQVPLLDPAFEKQIETTKQDIEEKAQHNYEMDRQVLQLLVFLWHWLVEIMEDRVKQSPKVIAKKSKSSNDSIWESTKHSNRSRAFTLVHTFVCLPLEVVFISSADLDLIINEYFYLIQSCLQVHTHLFGKLRVLEERNDKGDNIGNSCALRFKISLIGRRFSELK
jgi:hypothetical protein